MGWGGGGGGGGGGWGLIGGHLFALVERRTEELTCEGAWLM